MTAEQEDGLLSVTVDGVAKYGNGRTQVSCLHMRSKCRHNGIWEPAAGSGPGYWLLQFYRFLDGPRITVVSFQPLKRRTLAWD
jgi:hypothetical protein